MSRITPIWLFDVSGTEFIIMHCARCGSQVAMKLDAERNVTDQWIVPDAA